MYLHIAYCPSRVQAADNMLRAFFRMEGRKENCLGYKESNKMIELDVKISSGDLYDYMLRHTYNSPAGVIGSAFAAVLIVFAFYTQTWAFIVLGVFLLLYLPWTLFVKSRRQVRSNPSFQNPLHYVLDDTGITISQGEESVQYPWEELYKAVSTGRSIIVYTSPVNATLFPKKQIEDKKACVIEMISTHMPPDKVKIRG